MILQEKREIRVSRPICIGGKPHAIGDVVAVPVEDALYLVASGRAQPHPPAPAKKEQPEDPAKRRMEALGSGPYAVGIMWPCMVKGFRCEQGEVVLLDEDDAACLAMSGRGKIISRPAEEEDIEMKVSRMIEEKLRSG